MAHLQKNLFDRINQKAGGQLVVNYRGGPESIAAFDQGKAVQQGVVDFSTLPVGFYEPLVPGIGALMLSQLTLEEERSQAVNSYLQELHQKGGLYFVGRGVHATSPYFYTFFKNKKVETKEDFTKVKIGSATAARAAVIAWGAAHVSIGPADAYTVLERGVADGISGFPTTTIVPNGIHQIAKYAIDHTFYQNTVAVIMNLASWNKLPQNMKDVVMSSIIEAEKEIRLLDEASREETKKQAQAAGMEFYKLSPEMADWYLKTAYDAAWNFQQQRFPDVTPRLRELLTKK